MINVKLVHRSLKTTDFCWCDSLDAFSALTLLVGRQEKVKSKK